jgi:hypothetical protein
MSVMTDDPVLVDAVVVGALPVAAFSGALAVRAEPPHDAATTLTTTKAAMAATGPRRTSIPNQSFFPILPHRIGAFGGAD